METTAEGVETQEQLDWLRAEGCGHIQGYLLGRPMPPQDVHRFLHGFTTLQPVQEAEAYPSGQGRGVPIRPRTRLPRAVMLAPFSASGRG
nr:EAL domain-containing protein [Roseomonas gilardii]